ncbi:MAG: DUF6452 family protein [Bacteroidales bacterium]
MKPYKILLALLSLILLPSIVGCGNEGCQETISVNARCSFYKKSNNKSFSFDSITVYGVGAPDDSLLYNRSTSQSYVKLPLKKFTEESSYVFHFQGAESEIIDKKDTVTFYYKNQSYFISEDCGTVVHHLVDSVIYTRHYIDSLIIAKQSIINLDEENLLLLF